MKRRDFSEFIGGIRRQRRDAADETALESMAVYPLWQPDTHYLKDERVRCNDKLWRIRQEHTSQAHQPPGIDTASLYTEVTLATEGEDAAHPIEYHGNMELHEGKYYAQDGVTYRCTRDSGVPLYNTLHDLVGLYVEVVSNA